MRSRGQSFICLHWKIQFIFHTYQFDHGNGPLESLASKISFPTLMENSPALRTLNSQDTPTNYLNIIIILEQWFQTKKKHEVFWKCFPQTQGWIGHSRLADSSQKTKLYIDVQV